MPSKQGTKVEAHSAKMAQQRCEQPTPALSTILSRDDFKHWPEPACLNLDLGIVAVPVWIPTPLIPHIASQPTHQPTCNMPPSNPASAQKPSDTSCAPEPRNPSWRTGVPWKSHIHFLAFRMEKAFTPLFLTAQFRIALRHEVELAWQKTGHETAPLDLVLGECLEVVGEADLLADPDELLGGVVLPPLDGEWT